MFTEDCLFDSENKIDSYSVNIDLNFFLSIEMNKIICKGLEFHLTYLEANN